MPRHAWRCTNNYIQEYTTGIVLGTPIPLSAGRRFLSLFKLFCFFQVSTCFLPIIFLQFQLYSRSRITHWLHGAVMAGSLTAITGCACPFIACFFGGSSITARGRHRGLMEYRSTNGHTRTHRHTPLEVGAGCSRQRGVPLSGTVVVAQWRRRRR